jgi:hypothetical protein
MFPGETILTGAKSHEDDPHISEFKVMHTPGGWYVGTTYDGDGYEEACSRETDYFDKEEQAAHALEVYQKTGCMPGART